MTPKIEGPTLTTRAAEQFTTRAATESLFLAIDVGS